MVKIKLSQKLFSQLYEKEKLSTFEIAEKIGCCQTTIWKKLKEYKIKPRVSGAERVSIAKKELEFLYVTKRFSTWKIEKLLKIPRSTIHRKLKEFGIIPRDRADSHIIYERKNFSGDPLEKAYLIGFRIGDLGVRKIYPNSKTIRVASGSTIKEQIDLIKILFENYGKVWIKNAKKNKTNICVSLNLSFDFLLTKRFPEWIIKDKYYFFAFLAGFTDAEGHIGISKSMAYYSLGNYDYKLLFKIYEKLNEFGIICNPPYSDNRKGRITKEGYKYKENYWQFRIHTKKNLLSLLNELSKYSKHKNKIKDLNIALTNIHNRNKEKNNVK
jgi:hypothetical protein